MPEKKRYPSEVFSTECATLNLRISALLIGRSEILIKVKNALLAGIGILITTTTIGGDVTILSYLNSDYFGLF